MQTIPALALSVAVLGGIATWMFLTVGGILIWAAFMAWACFYHSGGDEAALRSTVVANAFGVLVAWSTALVIVLIPGGELLGPTIWPSLVVAITIAVYILAAKVPAFASIPGTTYGYACTFAFLLQTPDRFNLANLTSLSLANPLIVVPLSMWIGAVFAYASAKAAAAITVAE